MNIVVFGNCQAQSIGKFLSLSLNSSEYKITTYQNNSRTGNMGTQADILNGIAQADILIYQPLQDHHGDLSEKNILTNVVSKNCKLISFPYIFNSGAYSLIHSPRSPGRSYGKIYGENIIINLLEKHDLDTVLKLYENHQIDFDLHNRFEKCIAELARRESNTDIKLTEFITDNYQQHKLFLTCNHPTTVVFSEMCKQISQLVDLPLNLQIFDYGDENIADLVITKTPISPYDIECHGYQFDSNNNWSEIGEELISKIANYYNSKVTNNKSSLHDSVQTDVQAKMRKVRELFEKQDYRNVVESCISLLEDNPEHIPALSKLANSCVKIGSTQQALDIYERIVRINPIKDKVHVKIGQLRNQQNNFEGAVQAFKKAIAINPNQPHWIYTNLGTLLRNIENLDKTKAN